MTLQIFKNELEYYILTEKLGVEEEFIPQVAKLAYNNNYIQILYDYGIKVLLAVLKVLENHEEYEKCQSLVETIKDVNKLDNKKYPTRDEYK